MKSVKILIIMPAYNEEKNIASSIEDVKKNFPHSDILVINDGSRDATATIARRKGVLVLDFLENMGIGAAMQAGYKFTHREGYDIAIQCDGDGQHPADQISRLMEPIIRGEADIVIGSRFLKEKSFRSSLARRVGIKIFSTIISRILGQKMTDTTSGFRAVNREIMHSFSLYYPCDYPEVESLVLLHKEGFRMREIPILMKPRAGGRSSITFRKSAYYFVKVLLAVLLDLLRQVPCRKGVPYVEDPSLRSDH